MLRKLGAAIAALALTLTLVPAVFAGSITESVTVNSTMTVTGVPASINYGSVDPGFATGVQSFTASVVTNSAWQFKMSGSDFTGPMTLPKSVRLGQLTASTGNTSTVAPASFSQFGVVVFGSDPFDGTSINAAGNPGTSGFRVDLKLDLTDYAAAPAGSYGGSITYTFSAV